MAVYECILRPGQFNGKNGRFIGGARVTVTRPGTQSCNGSDIEKAMIEQYGSDAKGCGYIGYWNVKRID